MGNLPIVLELMTVCFLLVMIYVKLNAINDKLK